MSPLEDDVVWILLQAVGAGKVTAEEGMHVWLCNKPGLITLKEILEQLSPESPSELPQKPHGARRRVFRGSEG